MGEKKLLDKKEFISAWDNSRNYLYKLAPMMLALSIIFTFASGFMTWYGITYKNLAESSTLLSPLFKLFGVWTVFLFDLILSIVFFGYYHLTKELFLRGKKPSLKYVCTIPIMIFYILAFLNFLNDFGFTLNIIMIQNSFQKLGFESIKKILGG